MFQPIAEPLWNERPVFIIGGGPSFAQVDFEKIRSLGYVLGCNDAAFAIGADAVISMDVVWMRQRQAQIEAFPGEVWLAAPTEYVPKGWQREDIHWIEKRMGWALSDDARSVHGSNTGFSALNLAYLKGAREIYLFGMDLTTTPPERRHWHEGYTWSERLNYHGAYCVWSRDFEAAAPQLKHAGVKVVNVNPERTLPSYQRIPPDWAERYIKAPA